MGKVKVLQQKAHLQAKSKAKLQLPKSLGQAVQMGLLPAPALDETPCPRPSYIRNIDGVQKGQEQCHGPDCNAMKNQDPWGRKNKKGDPSGLLCRVCATKRDVASMRSLKERQAAAKARHQQHLEVQH